MKQKNRSVWDELSRAMENGDGVQPAPMPTPKINDPRLQGLPKNLRPAPMPAPQLDPMGLYFGMQPAPMPDPTQWLRRKK